jgi:hypothetical protein
MIDENFVEKILQLAPTQTLEINDRKYTNKQVYAVLEPKATTMAFATLTGLKDYIEQNLDRIDKDTVMLHVEDYRTVTIITGLSGPFRQRETLVRAQAQDCEFRFDKWYEREAFQIGLMASFAPTTNRDKVIQFVGNIVQKAEVQTEDDGFTQRVTAKAGIARVAEVDVPNPVTLKPYRTFPEADQPESDFIFRVKTNSNDAAVNAALYEADGGRWKLQAAMNIKEWLTENIPGVRVII